MQDIILSGVFALTFFVDGVLAANSAKEWRSLISVLDVRDRLGIDTMLDIRDSLAATAVSASTMK